MKKFKKMNNKGFSLVELIVVILIMAILAVALAPQVMKWVDNSRISSDAETYESMVSAVNLALADAAIIKSVKGASKDIEITIDDTLGVKLKDDDGNKLDNKLKSILGNDYKDTMKAKVSGELYKITVKKGTAAVERTDIPDAKSVS